MASLKFLSESHVRVRLHEKFLTAPQKVWDALAAYISRRRRSDWSVVADFASAIDTSAEKPAERKITLRQKGEVYDLAKIAKDVNRRFFNGRVKYRIGWGRERSVRSRRGRGISIRYGSWSRSSGIIRIHPLLDDRRVPQKFVEYIVFHEMLHAVVPSDHSDNGRRYDHPENFRAFERAYPEFDEMRRLAKELLHVLC
jgi:hypothetical protein